jgi:hypothetical protein
MFPSLLGLALFNRHTEIISIDQVKTMEKNVCPLSKCSECDSSSFPIRELGDSLECIFNGFCENCDHKMA